MKIGGFLFGGTEKSIIFVKKNIKIWIQFY